MRGKPAGAVKPLGLLAVLAIGSAAAGDVVSNLEVHYEFERSGDPGYNSASPFHGTACGG